MLSGKKILIGITGGIAAYKSILLIRECIKSGAEVKVVLTRAAHDFVSPTTLSTLSRNPVYTEFVKNELGEWTNHVELALWADLYIIAPCTANTLAKMANGASDSLLVATYLSAKCPVLIAPAMDLDMYAHPSTRQNIRKLTEYGASIIDATHGELASGLVGQGRMAEPEELISRVLKILGQGRPGKGRKVLVTAGPTQEPIDPVRFISNHSSGKMGYLIAEELIAQDFKVTLVTGPTQLDTPAGASVVSVTTAEEMFNASTSLFEEMDIAVLAAAVADYSPRDYSQKKVKKDTAPDEISLIRTPDIAQSLGAKKREDQFIVGFALETENEAENARKKLKSKNFDIIVLNSLKDPGAGFGHDTNKITIFDKDNNQRSFELKSKREVAKDIVKEIITRQIQK